MTWQFEDSATDQLITMLAMAPVQMTVALVWLIRTATMSLVSAAVENAPILAQFVKVGAATIASAAVLAIVAANPLILVGVCAIVVFAVVTKP